MSGVEPVTVLVLTLGRELLADCLASLQACDPRPAEILLIDQSERDAAAAIAARVGVGARVITMPREGIGAGMNLGLREATYDAVIRTDDDCHVRSDWVGIGARLMREHPDELHTGRVLTAEGDGHAPSTMESEVPAVHRGAPRADLLYAGCMAVSAQAMLRLGGFDPALKSAEDNDFCFRWMASGRAVRYTPDLTVWHSDWRQPAELRDLYRHYWTHQGVMIAKHLRRGDRRILPVLRGNLVWAAGGALRRRSRPWRRSGVPDATYGGVTRLPVGFVQGWREAGRPGPLRDGPAAR